MLISADAVVAETMVATPIAATAAIPTVERAKTGIFMLHSPIFRKSLCSKGTHAAYRK